MKIPKMILFDYGQTLVDEGRFDGLKGTGAVLRYAVKNKYQKTAAQVQAAADAINAELGRFDPKRRPLMQTELPSHMFTAYLYESQGIELSIKSDEIDRVFWDAAAPGKATEGVEAFLAFLGRKNIRTGVISNITYSGNVVAERIHTCLPENSFEFVIATSEYLFRKPDKRIFELALEKAGLLSEEVWYIGDNYACDIVGAADAGLFPVWYLGGKGTGDVCERENTPNGGDKKAGEKAGLVIREWRELMRMMESEMER